MDYYNDNPIYGPLLPLPPPSPFSTHDARRAVIPDFTTAQDPAEAFREWANHCVYFVFPKSTFSQFRASAICICGLIGVCSMIIGRRLWERSFWIFRMVRRGKGTVIVPNAMMAFTVFAGLFAILLVALNFELCRFFDAKEILPFNLIAWITLPWLSIKSGGVYAAWGTLYARPSALTSEIGRESTTQNKVKKFMTHPTVLNFLCFGPPIILDIAILVPSLIVNAQWNTHMHHYQQWRRQYATAPELTREMIIDMQSIWYGFIDDAQSIAAIYTFWAIQAALIWLCYTFVGIKLLLTIRRQICNLESREAAAVRETQSLSTRQSRREVQPPTPDEAPLTAYNVKSDGIDVASIRSPDDSSGRGILLQPMDAQQQQQREQRRDGQPSQQDESYFTTQQVAADQPVPSFFPPVRPSKLVDDKVLNKGSPSTTQTHYLRRVYSNFLVQFVAIDVAIVMFCAIAMFGAIVAAPIFEVNNQGAGLSRALLWASWNSVFFGLIVLGAIVGRVYEPIQFAASEALPTSAIKKIKTARPRRFSLLKRGAGNDSRRPPSWLGAIDQIRVHTTTYTEETSPVEASPPSAASHNNALALPRMSREPRPSTSTRASSITEPLDHQQSRYAARRGIPARYYQPRKDSYRSGRRSSDATYTGSADPHKKEDDEGEQDTAQGQVFVDSLPLSFHGVREESQDFEPESLGGHDPVVRIFAPARN